jgi:hypothetical protein
MKIFLPLFPNHDTNSDNTNYTATLYLYYNVKFSNPTSDVQISNFKQFHVPVLVLTNLRIAHRINSN